MSSTATDVGDSVIFSTPTTATTSASPLAMLEYAWYIAALPEAHAASTLIVGLGSSPQYSPTKTAGSNSALHPPTVETTNESISFCTIPASSMACFTDSHASSSSLASFLLPNFDWPAPTTATERKCTAWLSFSLRRSTLPTRVVGSSSLNSMILG